MWYLIENEQKTHGNKMYDARNTKKSTIFVTTHRVASCEW